MKTRHSSIDTAALSRAQGCLLGQLAGDALGSLVEFQTPEQIRRDHPNGVRELADGGMWDTIAGQPLYGAGTRFLPSGPKACWTAARHRDETVWSVPGQNGTGQ